MPGRWGKGWGCIPNPLHNFGIIGVKFIEKKEGVVMMKGLYLLLQYTNHRSRT